MNTRLQDCRKLIQDKPLLPTMLSMSWNLAYAIFNGILGLVYQSHWFIILGIYYAVLGFMRLSVVTIRDDGRRTESSVMRHNGVAMLALSIVLCGVTILAIREHQNPVRNMIVMIAIATFTFILMWWTIRNAVRAYRDKSKKMITLRNISSASAIGSMLSLERAMIGTFGNASDSSSPLMEAISGAFAFILLVAMGIGMIRQTASGRR